jgi:hypothetical protein
MQGAAARAAGGDDEVFWHLGRGAVAGRVEAEGIPAVVRVAG